MGDALAKVSVSMPPLNETVGVDHGHLITELYQRYASELCRYVVSKFGAGPPEPEDVVQAAFTRLASLEEPRSVENPKAYLYTTVRNIVVDHHRHANRHQSYVSTLKQENNQESMYETAPENVLQQRERFEVFAKALKRLPAKRRRMILLNRYEGLTCEAIGQRFGMSGPAVQKQIERGLAECLRYLEAAEQTGPHYRS